MFYSTNNYKEICYIINSIVFKREYWNNMFPVVYKVKYLHILR